MIVVGSDSENAKPSLVDETMEYEQAEEVWTDACSIPHQWINRILVSTPPSRFTETFGCPPPLLLGIGIILLLMTGGTHDAGSVVVYALLGVALAALSVWLFRKRMYDWRHYHYATIALKPVPVDGGAPEFFHLGSPAYGGLTRREIIAIDRVVRAAGKDQLAGAPSFIFRQPDFSGL